MKKPFRTTRTGDHPFLSPLAAQHGLRARWRGIAARLPDAALPIAFMLAGGIALVALLGTLLAGGPQGPAPETIAATTRAPSPTLPEPKPASSPPVPEPVQATPDPARTASILAAIPDPEALLPKVDVAETEREIAALEAIQRREVEADVGAPAQQATASLETENMRAATTTNYVNMRASANDDAEIIQVVPALAAIEAEDDCNWCAVVYEGRTGYIYRSFISYR